MTNEIILGYDFIKKFNVYINPQTGHAFTNISPYLTQPSHFSKNVNVNAFNSHKITIPGRSECKVKLKTNLPDDTYHVNIDNELIPNALGIAIPGLVTVENGNIWVLIANCTDTPLTLDKNDPIILLTPDTTQHMSISALTQHTSADINYDNIQYQHIIGNTLNS